MTNPQILVEELEKLLSQWAKLGRRAQLEAAMPIVNLLVEHRASYQILADMMTNNGLEIGGHALRQALHRWRQKGSNQSVVSPSMSSVPHEMPLKTSIEQILQTSPVFAFETLGGESENERAPLTKERLREIREEHIDLDEIRRQAKRKRQQQS